MSSWSIQRGHDVAKRILIVEDESELVMALEIRLKEAGYEVLVAYHGSEGLEMARKEVPDLIVLDINLPNLDGYKVCSMLRLDPVCKQIPVIMLTARNQKSDEKHGFEVGANAYIIKPFDNRILVEKIHELLKE
jgi:DNA-binding response OmpR family regulator